MYKAIHAQTGQEIIILNPEWKNRIEQLRSMDHADLLVCQGCRQPLRVKAGEFKRSHFAHKHLKACSFGSESPEILNARAVIYEWLLIQFGSAVTLEKPVEGSGLPRPVDCWVESQAEVFAYWVIEAGIKLETRQAILAALSRPGLKSHFVILNSMLNEEKKEFHSLLLTPTERAFLQETPYDQVQPGAGRAGGSLHYLDAESSTLITYRNLTLFHRPNWFHGMKKTAGLETVRANRLDGSFIYPGESDRLNALRKKQERLEQKRRQFEERRSPGVSSPPISRRKGWGISDLPEAMDTPEGAEPLTCVTCGQITRDYWATFFDSDGLKVCRCRNCLDRQTQGSG